MRPTLQKARLLTFAVVAGACSLSLSPAALAASDTASGAGALATRASIDVSITVPRVMQMRLLGHPAALDITADDIARGSVTVSGPSLDLLVNDRLGYVLRAQLVNAVFTAVRIAGLPSPLIATTQEGSVHMPSMAGRPKPQPVAVEYELRLAPDAAPGRYAWPVALSLQQP